MIEKLIDRLLELGLYGSPYAVIARELEVSVVTIRRLKKGLYLSPSEIDLLSKKLGVES